jgi:paraquat-inducible protein B
VQSVALLLDSRDMHAQIPVYLRLNPEKVTIVGGRRQFAPGQALRRLIEVGLRAELIAQSLVTGQMLVELNISPERPARFVGAGAEGVPEIPAIPSDLQQLRQQLTEAPIAQTVAQAQRTLVAIEKIANRLDAQLDPLTAGARGTLDSATRTMDEAGTAVQQIQASVQQVQKDATATLEVAQALLRDARRQLEARGGELSRALLSADQTLHSANTLVGSANGLVAPRSQSRSDLEATLRDVAASASALRDFSQTIERNPSTILRGR